MSVTDTLAGPMLKDQDAAEATFDPVSGFVTDLLAPVSEEMPVGSDPFYGDRFYAIKREIDKLADNDWQSVITNSHALLATEGKDLRVAAYHLMASVYVNGVQGFIDGLAIYAGLLQNYGRHLFPARENARQTAVRWLGNRKMQIYCEERLAEASAEELEWMRATIDSINVLLGENFGNGIDRWNHLDALLAQLADKAKSSEPASAVTGVEAGRGSVEATRPGGDGSGTGQGDVQMIPAAPASGAAANTAASSPATLDEVAAQPVSEQQLLRHTRELIRYLTEAGDLCRAAAMARAVLWGSLQLPPADGNSTSVPGPRGSDLAEIRQLLADQEFSSAMTLIEALLFGPGGRLSLDLQYFAVQAAGGMKQKDLVQIIENATAGLLKRLPKLVDLQFEDGAPFAQAETRRWLEGLSAGGDAAVGSQAIDDAIVQQVVQSAREAMAGGGLASALAVFAAATNSHPLTAFRLQMEMARFCLVQQRADLAVPAFQKLMEKAHRKHLASWNPELLASLAKAYRDALQAMWEQSSEERKPDYEQRIEELSVAMCQADLVQASRFL